MQWDFWVQGFQIASASENLVWLLLGTVVGLVVGVMPAIGANLGVAVMLPLTFTMDPVTGVIFLVAIHAAGNYGDSIASILLNTPGGVGTVATCWDGYPMAKMGQGGKAIGIATFGSFAGGFAAWIVLAVMAGPITRIALKFGAPEYFALGLMALMLVSIGAKGETLKGIILACLGLFLSFVGQDPVSGVVDRFAFGLSFLTSGIPIVASCLGVFAISEMIAIMEKGGSVAEEGVQFRDSAFSGLYEVLKRPMTLLRGGLVGFFVGILPALGTSLAGIASYLVEKATSKEGKNFGKGEPAGVLAAEVGKGACVVGDLIPTFTLGVPGSATAALLMAALTIHGIQPGPMFMKSSAMPYAVFAGIVLAQTSFVVSGLYLARWFSLIVYVPIILVGPVVVALCYLGAFVERNNFIDIALMLGMGILTYFLKRLGYPVVCLILGLILGPLVESNLHRALGIEYGSWLVFIHRPATLVMLIVTAGFMLFPFILACLPSLMGSQKTAKGAEQASAPAPLAKGANPVLSEAVLLIILVAGSVIMLCQARAYSWAVGLLPNLVLRIMLGLCLWRLVILVRQHLTTKEPAAERVQAVVRAVGDVPWQTSLSALFAYIVLAWLIGLVASTFVYVLMLPVIAKYRRWTIVMATAAGSAVTLVLLSMGFELILPRGVLF